VLRMCQYPSQSAPCMCSLTVLFNYVLGLACLQGLEPYPSVTAQPARLVCCCEVLSLTALTAMLCTTSGSGCQGVSGPQGSG